MTDSISEYKQQIEERKQLGNNINFMQQHEFESLIEMMNISKSQRWNIERMLHTIDKERKNGMIHENKAVLFGIPSKVGTEIWVTVRSETLDNSMLCLTDLWYNVRLGQKGKIEIKRSSVGESDGKTFDDFIYLHF